MKFRQTSQSDVLALRPSMISLEGPPWTFTTEKISQSTYESEWSHPFPQNALFSDRWFFPDTRALKLFPRLQVTYLFTIEWEQGPEPFIYNEGGIVYGKAEGAWVAGIVLVK